MESQIIISNALKKQGKKQVFQQISLKFNREKYETP